MPGWYEVKIEPDSDTWLATVPAYPEVTTFGETQEAACINARSAIEEAMAARIAAGDPLPTPRKSTPGKGWFVELPLLIFFKAGLYVIARGKGVTKAELARRLKVHREQVDRLFRLDHNSQVGQIEDAYRALGYPLRFDIPFDQAA